MKPGKILYVATVQASGGGRSGQVKSDDGMLRLNLALPKEFGGDGQPGTNPEQLFAGGYAACFLGAINLVSRQRKVSLPAEPSVTARVGIGPIPQGYALDVVLFVDLPGVDPELARAIVEDADKRCPYSNAIRGNINVEFKINSTTEETPS